MKTYRLPKQSRYHYNTQLALVGTETKQGLPLNSDAVGLFNVNPWLERESLVQTFDEDLKCNVVEIRTLLDEVVEEENEE